MQQQLIAVVGAGQMGSGIAQVFAQAGYQVILNDLNDVALERARNTISTSLSRLAQKNSEIKPDAVLARIRYSTAWSALADADLAIEAASERLDIKLELMHTLSDHVRADAIIASNTSSISLTVLAAQVQHPERVIGLHFMNPVPLMALVEVIRARQSSDATHQAALDWVTRLGKTAVSVNDAPGFVSNRVLMPMINEAVFTLYEGVADANAIDTVMRLGMNHPIGPLALADLIGLDTCVAIMDVLYTEFRDSKYRVCPLLTQMVAAGQLGRKSRQGFYDYPQSKGTR